MTWTCSIWATTRLAGYPQVFRSAPRATKCPLCTVVDQDLIETLRAAVLRLPLDQRLAIELRLRGVSSQEIGRILGVNPATIRKRESRAVERLRGPFQASAG